MAQGDQLAGPLGGLNRGNSSDSQDIAFLGPAGENQFQRRGRHADGSVGARDAARLGLVADADHPGLSRLVEVTQLSRSNHAFRSGEDPRPADAACADCKAHCANEAPDVPAASSRELGTRGGIILFMRILCVCLGILLTMQQATAQSLPELGDASATVLSPQMERRIGEQAMREIRQQPNFVDDPELTEYINVVGHRIVAAADTRQDFEFFLVRDKTINAFSMPGGFVGVNTGLLLAAQTESELAGVLAHEIAHVTQHHIARMFGKQDQMSIPMLAALVLGLLAARSNPDVTQAVIAGTGAASIQSQLDYSRDFEREADRIGFQYLQQAGFDPSGMATFFERLQKDTRLYENNAPAYLRTHPLTTERIADMQNRAQLAVYKQAPDSIEFHLARAKLRAEEGSPPAAVAYFDELVRQRRYASEAGARYGLAAALARARNYARAGSEVETLRKLTGNHPMVELLAARIRMAVGDGAGARDILRAALVRSPDYRPLHYAYVDTLQRLGEHQAALAWLSDLVKNYPHDARLYSLEAKSFAASGKRLLHHQALAETYFLQGTLPAAIEQLQLAQKSGDGDFYQLSAVEARLRDLRALQAREAKRP